MRIKVIKKNERLDGFSHVWELQAQQAKETLEGITKKFGDGDRLGFDIRKYSRRPECDVYVTVDGAPFITVEFEGGKTGNIHWHCFNDDIDSSRLDMADEDAARNLILRHREDILDALESLYGFGAIADEDAGAIADEDAGAFPDGFVYIKPDPRYNRAKWGKRGADFGTFTGKLYKRDRTYTGLVYVQDSLREFSTDGKTGYFRDTHHKIPTENVDYAALWKECQRLFRMNKDWQGIQTEENAPAKTEASPGDKWCVEFGDIYNNVKKEYYATEADAKTRYDELAERGDIEWVEKPAIVPESKEETLSYSDYAESVKTILMGREFEYGPETANQFVVDDYKDIVRKNYDAGKGALSAAADIDAAYMGKE